ncbi:hypothetical protein FKM82_014620 [Ascaphus truei]
MNLLGNRDFFFFSPFKRNNRTKINNVKNNVVYGRHFKAVIVYVLKYHHAFQTELLYCLFSTNFFDKDGVMKDIRLIYQVYNALQEKVQAVCEEVEQSERVVESHQADVKQLRAQVCQRKEEKHREQSLRHALLLRTEETADCMLTLLSGHCAAAASRPKDLPPPYLGESTNADDSLGSPPDMPRPQAVGSSCHILLELKDGGKGASKTAASEDVEESQESDYKKLRHRTESPDSDMAEDPSHLPSTQLDADLAQY